MLFNWERFPELKVVAVLLLLHSIVSKVPGGQNAQAFVGTSILLGLCAIPVFLKDTKGKSKVGASYFLS
jgi:hypothetical protein